MPPWSRRPRPRDVNGRQGRGVGAGAEPRRHARRRRQGARHRPRRTSPSTSRCSAAASAASPSATSPSRRPCSPRRWAARRSRWCGRARTTSATASTTPSRPSASRPASTPAARWSPGGTAARRRRIMSTFAPDPKHQAPFELGMGLVDTPFDVPTSHGEPARRSAHAHRLVPLGLEHAARLLDPVVRRRARACSSATDPKDFLLELIGPARIVDPASRSRTCWNYGEPVETYPIDTGAPAQASSSWPRRRRGWGKQLPKGQGLGIAAHRSFVSYVATVVRRGGRRQGQDHHPARRHRDRLRLLRQSRARPLADRGRGRHGADASPSTARSPSRTARSSRATSTTTSWSASTRRRTRRNVHIVPHGIDMPPAASASRACRRSRRRSATRSSPRPASASARCRSATNWRRSGNVRPNKPFHGSDRSSAQ